MKTPNPPTEDPNQLAKDIINSLLRDFFAAAVVAGANASYQDGWPDPGSLADHAYDQAEYLLLQSKTPNLVQKLKQL